MLPKLLIVEQNKELNSIMSQALIEKDYAVLQASNTNDAFIIAHQLSPELIIVDKAAPQSGGMEFCKSVRKEAAISRTPIIMLGATGNSTERIEALDAGANEYLVTPFQMEDLITSIKVLIHRGNLDMSSRIMSLGNIKMDLDSWIVTIAEKPVKLTTKEFRLLQELMEAKGRVLSRDFLLRRVWGLDKELDIQTRTVDIHMSRLRSKLGAASESIITVRNIGYRVDISPEWIRR